MVSYPTPIPDNALDLTPLDPGFSADFDSTLGNAATSTDGFDAMFLDVVNAMAGVPDLVSSMDPDLNDAGAALPDLATPWEGTYGDALTSAIASGDPDFQLYDVHLSGGNPPASGGSGGGGGGGGGTGSGTPLPGGGSTTVAADFPSVTCWSAVDLTTPTQAIAGHGAYQIAPEVFDRGESAFAFVTAAVFSQKDDAQWQKIIVTSDGGIILDFDPLIVGKTKAVVQVTCKTDPTTRFLCYEITVSGGGTPTQAPTQPTSGSGSTGPVGTPRTA